MGQHNYHLVWVPQSARFTEAIMYSFKEICIKTKSTITWKLWLGIKWHSLYPIIKDNLPAPVTPIELSLCSCKGVCSTQRCKCFKNSPVHIDMYKCSACNNSDAFEDNDQDIYEYD